MFLGLMPNLDPKGDGDNSMVENQWSCPGVGNGALGDPCDMANKLDCLNPNLWKVRGRTRRNDTRNRCHALCRHGSTVDATSSA
jgi:hypothetical protein